MKKKASAVAVKTVTSRPVLLLWSSVSVSVALLCAWSYSQPAWILRPASEIGLISTDTTSSPSPLSTVRAQRSAISQQEEDEEELIVVTTTTNGAGRSAIPLVQIGLFDMCIYSTPPPAVPQSATTTNTTMPRENESSDGVSVTCVPHEALDDEWLPPAWQVTRAVCGGACLILFACAAASVAVAFIDQQHQQERCIKWTAVAQLTAAVLMLVGLCSYPLGLQSSETLHHFCDQRCQPGWSSLVAAMSSAAAFLCPVIASLVSNPIYHHDLNPWEAYLLL